MPTYTFKSNETDEVWEDVMSHTKLEAYYKEHNCEQVIGVPTTIQGRGEGRLKTTDAFNDRLKEMHKKAGKKSTMGETIR